MKTEIKKSLKKFRGTVVKIIDEKGVIVAVNNLKTHPLYKKRYFRKKRYKVATDKLQKKGEGVEFVETRPLSRGKKWRII